ncbi:hypothetical protein [Micromonospora sp. WMMC273]|uniref:hypothetical protein n=1 Tax=Micromonospora sp. WMMC273 TaxID=3015157 RepID=UPI0022B61D2F|nr:hypothetical protein [Micromonospora sp. WMMC273]MCZ7478882.1 hypothetical protein [Micromonospora sp. WMMC273]
MAGASVRVARIVLDVDQGDVEQIGRDFALELVTDVTRRTYNRANVLTPVDTGNLRAHNQMVVDVAPARVVGTVFNDAEYADVVHDGSGPYTIRPRRAKALRFEVGGRVVFARKVRHPGTRARPWIARACEEVAIPEGFLWTPG